MNSHYSAVIVGGGQAGLSMSYCLKERGLDHIVFEKNKIGYSWRSKRWDSFCLVTPNQQCKLPGYSYPGDDLHGLTIRHHALESGCFVVNATGWLSPEQVGQITSDEKLQRVLSGGCNTAIIGSEGNHLCTPITEGEGIAIADLDFSLITKRK